MLPRYVIQEFSDAVDCLTLCIFSVFEKSLLLSPQLGQLDLKHQDQKLGVQPRQSNPEKRSRTFFFTQ